ncbi:unnamed protein product, partial [Staurois parvus]
MSCQSAPVFRPCSSVCSRFQPVNTSISPHNMSPS